MADEGLHDIQLKGKQLVFLFMSATVVAVVVFLCGVMVGRGVGPQRADPVTVAGDVPSDPTAAAEALSPAPSSDPLRPEGGSASSGEDLSYPGRLAGDVAPTETLKSESPATTPAPVTSAPPPPAPVRAPAATAAPASQGNWTVQVAAVKESAEAEEMAKRLTTRGYAAYVNPPMAGAPRMFRVRVGSFADRAAAESIAARLEKEEQFKPWITR